MAKPKVLIIFPHYSDNEANHYPYWFRLFQQAPHHLEVAILFESHSTTPILENITNTTTQRLKTKPFNLLERLLIIFRYRLSGYDNIYIHYSYFSLFITKLISFFLPLKTFYWNCEYYTSKTQSDALLPRALKLTDILVTGSPLIASQYQKIFGINKEKLAVVPNYVIPSSPKPLSLDQKKYHILFVHTLSPRKGALELPQIITTSLEKIKNAHFHIIGDGPLYSWLKEQPQTPHLKDSVSLYGALPQARVAQFFKSCNMFIMPSRSEGFPRVILEASSNKIPITTTDVGNVKEIVGKIQQKYLVQVNQPKLFTETLLRLAQSTSNKQLIDQNYQQSLNYNFDSSLKKFVSLFN